MPKQKQAPSMYEPRVKEVTYSKFARPGSVPKKVINPIVNSLVVREDGLQFKSLKSVSTAGGSTAKVSDKKYTGSSMIGVSLVHKSCLQPVFSEDQAKDFAQMRR